MKIALYQMFISIGDKKMNLLAAEKSVEDAAAAGADLLVLPEFWAVGFCLDRIGGFADEPGTGVFSQMAQWAAEYGIALAGTHPRISDGAIYNTAVIFNAQGELLSSYDKMHLFSLMKEERYITAGTQLPEVFDFGGLKTAMITCFDLRFPELARQTALGGAELLLIPAYWPAPRLEHWSLLLRARAVENQLYAAGCNRSTVPGKLEFGRSAVIRPDGTAAAEAGSAPVLLIADIDPAGTAENRRVFPAFTSRIHGAYGQF